MLQRAKRLVSTLLAGASPPTVASDEPRSSRSAGALPQMPSRVLAQSVVDALPDAAFVLDRDTRMLAANAAAQDVFGRMLMGEPLAQTVRHPELAGAVTAALATNRKTDFLLTLKAPTQRHLDGAASPLIGFGAGQGAPAVLLVLQDISEREALARMRVEFVANASHELRTPLAALSGFIETLKGPARDDPAARDRFLTIMGDQAQRMTRLIDDLLLLSRVEMRAHVAPLGRADLALVAAEAIKQVTSAAKRDDVTIATSIDAASVTLPGDHDELVQAVQNLLSNAVKYGKAGGKIAVRIARVPERRGGSALKLSVTDDGPGISAEHLPRLTERFYRVSTAASREKGGTGLGLAIVKHIAARHRGRIEVESTIGTGTTFSLVFPLSTTDDGPR